MSVGARTAGWLGTPPGRRAWLGLAAGAAAVAVAALLWPAREGTVPLAGLQRQFREAGRAYGEGRAAEAARLYEDLLLRGYASTEVFYNLGNSHFRAGRLGPAVLNYRKAWRLAPRDAALAANQRLALQAAGAAEPDLSSFELALTRLSSGEWAAVAAAAWWAACLGLCLAVRFRSRRRAFLGASLLAAGAAAAALFGLATWRGFERSPELVIQGETVNALAAPLASASPRFALPEGSVVRAREYQGEWVGVTNGQLSGWVRRSACLPVLLEGATGSPASAS